ncbi:hypothetical protein ACI2LC_38685 [Nonomuraea wenchangensis]|uniref:hypothetical protein n=1 Tax=Nonomuraea wenchangensis TaxID=568860 RepID=UPI0033CBDB25
MPEITTAVDESGATALVAFAESQMRPITASDTAQLGPFKVGYSASATMSGGSVDLRTPDRIRIADFQVHWSARLTLSADLPLVPDLVIGPISVRDTATATADLTVDAHLVNDSWEIVATIQGTPNIAFGAGTRKAVAVLVAAVSAIPIVGPILAGLIGMANVGQLLSAIVSPLLKGQRLPLPFALPRRVPLPKAAPTEADAFVILDAVNVAVESSGGEDELVVTADLRP